VPALLERALALYERKGVRGQADTTRRWLERGRPA